MTPFFYEQTNNRREVYIKDRRLQHEHQVIGVVYDPTLAEYVVKALNADQNYVTGQPRVFGAQTTD